MKRLLAASCAALAAAAAYSAYGFYVLRLPAAPPLPPGTPLVRPSDLSDPASFLAGGRGAVSIRGQALRLRTLARPPQPYEVQLRAPTAAPVRAGDLLAARFYVRRPLFSPAKARVDFVFEQVGGEYRKSIVLPAEAGLRWRRIDVPFRSAGDYPAGGAQIAFRLGFGAQTVELAGFELVGLGRSPVRVPAAGFYEGREPGAPWRKAAEERIERIRKAGITVKVVDPDGKPAPGAAVQVRLKRHAFFFGSAINSATLFSGGRDDDRRRYKETFLRLFNSATIENGLKWPFWKGEQRAWADKTAAWLKAGGIKLRGHTLVWPGWEHMPEGMENLKNDPDRLRKTIRGHITEEAAYYRGKAAEWDVLNEPIGHPEVLGLLGRGEALEWFRLARKADPEARLFVNDYDVLDGFGLNLEQQDRYEALIRRILSDGAPLDGVGLQCHFRYDLTPPERLLRVLDRFGRLGKPLQATELDVEVADEELQADYLRDFMTAMFSHPAVEGITLWGFWEGVHSEPVMALYRRDWSKKPAAAALEELLLKDWNTQTGGTADWRGEYRARAFLGDYEITASSGPFSAASPASLAREGASLTLTLRR